MQINQLPDKATFCELAKKFNVVPVCVESPGGYGNTCFHFEKIL